MAKKPRTAGLPSREQIRDYLRSAPGEVARRDVARAFGVKGEDRRELRRMLIEMADAGDVDFGRRRRMRSPAELGPVAPVDVMSVDDDGDLFCMPAGWRGEDKPPIIRLSARAAAKLPTAPGVGDRFLARLHPAGDDGYTAQFIKALGKGAHRFLAVYRRRPGGAVAEPVERRTRHDFFIERGDEGGAKDGDLVWIETKGARGYGPMKARVREIAGNINDRGSYSLIAVAGHGIPIEFSAAALAEAAQATNPPLGAREDLREAPLITIDPEDARDHDDAVFAAPDDDPANPGGYRLIVAIADVSWFVAYGGALDREARLRGNSVYLPDRVVPMLPETLSNDLCSLRENEDRACLFVEMKLDAKGRKKAHRFSRALMRSAAKLSYKDAQKIIEGAPAPRAIAESVRHLHAAYRARLEERAHRAPLDLELVERRVVLGADGKVERIEKRERFDAHRLIEEFMILANIAAAETLEEKRCALIYRIHDAPDPERVEATRDYLESLGYSLARSALRPAQFNQILAIAGARGEKEMISEVVLRTQRQAEYSTENVGHFGLNLPRYAHFTSPIRRYADLAVHRALVAAARLGKGAQTAEEAQELTRTAEMISDFERRAMAAERESKDRYLADYLSGRVGAEFDGRIRGVTRFGLFVMLDETGADGFVPIREAGAERFRFDEARHALVGETTGGLYRLGQAVRVRLSAANPLSGGLRFDMLSEPLGVDAAPFSRPPAGKKKRKTKTKAKTKAKRKTGKPAKRIR